MGTKEVSRIGTAQLTQQIPNKQTWEAFLLERGGGVPECLVLGYSWRHVWIMSNFLHNKDPFFSFRKGKRLMLFQKAIFFVPNTSGCHKLLHPIPTLLLIIMIIVELVTKFNFSSLHINHFNNCCQKLLPSCALSQPNC